MKLIPVIDLMAGHVVRARHGLRSQYRPIESKLGRGSRAEDIVAALLDLYPFDTLYIADLDAVEQTGNHFSVIEKLAALFPMVEFWVDSGIREAQDLERWRKPRFRPVIGSECLADCSLLERQVILSLDFDGARLRGPAPLFSSSAFSPQHVIIMSLKRVGSELGPDFERLESLKTLAPEKNLYCAGGVRNAQDLYDLKKMGAAGVLLASALHDETLGAADLRSASSVQKLQP
ncbi:MAG: HisA/HisF-related TIM barrel protein [Burkholderiales bacterium]